MNRKSEFVIDMDDEDKQKLLPLPVSVTATTKWTKEMDELLVQLAEQCQCWEWISVQSAQCLEGRIRQLQWWSLGLSVSTTTMQTISSQLSSLAKDDEKAQRIVGSLANVVSLVSGIGLTILSTLTIFLNYKNSAVKFRQGANQCRRMYTRLVTLLNVAYEERPTNAAETYLLYTDEYNKVIQSAPTVPSAIICLFEEKFGKSKIHKPVLMGDIDDLSIDPQDGHGVVFA